MKTHEVRLAKEAVEAGLIGDIFELRGRGKEDANRGGGEDLWVLGSHVLDLMRFFGGDPTTCYATVLNKGHPATKADVVAGNEGIGPLTGDFASSPPLRRPRFLSASAVERVDMGINLL